MNTMRRIVTLATAGMALSLQAGPVTGWTERNGLTLSGAATDAPTIGDGSASSADASSIYAAFPEFTLAVGDTITLGGSVTLSGMSPSGENFRVGLFDVNGSSDLLGWLGYFAQTGHNSSTGDLQERSNPNTGEYMSSTGAAVLGQGAVPDSSFNDGTYTFLFSLERVPTGLQIESSIWKGAEYAGHSFLDTSASTFSFNRAAFLVGDSLNTDQAAFSDVRVSVTLAPPSDWVSIFDPQANTPRFAGTSASTASPVTTEAHQDAIASNFSSCTLVDGESITLAGSVTFTASTSLPSGNFRMGLFNQDDVITQDDGTGFKGIWTAAATGSALDMRYNDGGGSNPTSPFVSSGQGPLLVNNFSSAGGTAAAGTAIDFSLVITRDGDLLDIESSYTNLSGFDSYGSVNDLDILSIVPTFDYTFNSAAFLMAGSLNGSQAAFSKIAVSVTSGTSPYPIGAVNPPDPPDPGILVDFAPATRLFGIDFNCADTPGEPSQSRCRIIRGSADPLSNTSSYSKTVGAYGVSVTQPGGTDFEFRGAQADSSRQIPGGDISRSFLVADFIATREGAVNITVTNLPAGDYLFRSFHLDTYDRSDLGFAHGASTTTPNTILASIDTTLLDLIHPTALGSSGLGTTFINNSQVPTLAFAFHHDGASPLIIELRCTKSPDGTDFPLLLNGFELYEDAP